MPPGWTEFSAVKVAASVVVVNDRLPYVESRLSKAISDGEFTRVGTWLVLKVGESCRFFG